MVPNLQLKMLLVIGLILLFLGIPHIHAAPITEPSGLNPGDQYRLVFVTSGTRDAKSDDIEAYNSFVTGEAASPALIELQTSWFAIASTPLTSARQNTNTDFVASAPGVPIFNLAGETVARDYGDLWDGDIMNPIDVLADGTRLQAVDMRVWTGTDYEGYFNQASPLGTPVPGTGDAANPYLGWIKDWANPFDNYEMSHRLYGMSEILTVQNPVPAPTSIVLLSSGIFGLLGLRRKGRKV